MLLPRKVHTVGLTPDNSTCTDLWNNANATGLGSFMSPQISELEKTTSGGPGADSLEWALTINAPPVSEASNVFNNVVWLGTPPDVNLNNGNNPFSACAMLFTDLPLNTIERAQTATNGTCEATLDANCINAITTKAAAIAQGLAAGCTPGASSNCTSVQDVCDTIFAQLGTQEAFPQECTTYFDVGSNDQTWPSANVTAITTNNTDFSGDTCAVQPKGQRSFSFVPTFDLTDSLWGANGNPTHDDQVYDNLTLSVYPILSVFMPPVNGTRSQAFQRATAQMTCLRTRNESAGSRTPVALPAPTPVIVPSSSVGISSSSAAAAPGLPAGTIAGIAVAGVVGLALLGSAAFFVWRRRRHARTRGLAYATRLPSTQAAPSGVVGSSDPMNPFLSGSTFRAIGLNGAYGAVEGPKTPVCTTLLHEVPTTPTTLNHHDLVELPPDSAAPTELDSRQWPAEVPAHEARIRQSLMRPGGGSPASAFPRSATAWERPNESAHRGL